MSLLKYILISTFVGLNVVGSLHAAKATPPNIVFVLVDDQRYSSLGCYGHTQIETPIVDSLAANGVRFQNAFAQTPICMASRACLFTGLTTTTHGYAGGPSPSKPVVKEDVESSFPTLLRQAGYRTGFFGKQHVKFNSVNGMSVMFDESAALSRNPYLKKQPDGSLRHTDEIMGDKSVAFLNAHPVDKPFFLYMSFNISHAEDNDRRPGYHFQWPLAENGLYEELEPQRPDLDDPIYFESAPSFLRNSMNRDRYFWRWDTEEKYRINMRAYYRMLAGMDRIVGRMLNTLEAMGVADNTVIIYSADNGYYMGDRGFAGKWSHFEQSLHVPMIIYDPRMASDLKGRVLEQTVTHLDIPATILDLAGLQIPEKYQGVTLTPLLNGEDPNSWRTDLYCEHHYNHNRIPKWFGVRDDRYTYANYYEKKIEVLYDRQDDPTQLANVAGDPNYGDVLAELRQRSVDYKAQYTRNPLPPARGGRGSR